MNLLNFRKLVTNNGDVLDLDDDSEVDDELHGSRKI